jgi:hypothetical protein
MGAGGGGGGSKWGRGEGGSSRPLHGMCSEQVSTLPLNMLLPGHNSGVLRVEASADCAQQHPNFNQHSPHIRDPPPNRAHTGGQGAHHQQGEPEASQRQV